jgi:hypothetical protein
MVLGDLGRARRLAGNPSIGNVSDADITQGLAYGTSRAIGLTGKGDWETDTTHRDYAAVVAAVEYYASSYIRDRFLDQGDISTEHYTRANELLTSVVDSLATVGGSGGAGGATAGSATRTYRTYPLNNSALPYRSMQGTGQMLIGTSGGYEIP